MKQKTVFLIDDDPEDLEFMNNVLKRVDSSLLRTSFISPEEGLRILTKELRFLPDYIFIDINMPKITGEECLMQLRGNSKFLRTPIILYSTSMPLNVSQKLLNAGANFTFAKPNTELEYFTILESIILGDALKSISGK
jgi:CheY-like chemotaxis protein